MLSTRGIPFHKIRALSSQLTSRCEAKAEAGPVSVTFRHALFEYQCLRALRNLRAAPTAAYHFYLLSSLCFCLSIMTGFGGGWNSVGSPSPFIRHIEEENHPVKIKSSETPFSKGTVPHSLAAQTPRRRLP